MFLDLPSIETKPRSQGLTCLIDSGQPVEAFADTIKTFSRYIDYVKFGWGTGVVTPRLEEKIACLRENQVGFWFGGTLFEISYRQNRLTEMVEWVKGLGGKHFEISDGAIPLESAEKLRLIADLAQDFTVLSEVGSKDTTTIMSPARWIEAINRELDAGAWKVVAEGRESGTAGIFRDTGEIRAGLILEIVESGIDINNILFEAPKKSQQVWLIKTLGCRVNLCNVAFADPLNLTTLRLGLRFDTM